MSLKGPAETWLHSVREDAGWVMWDDFVVDFLTQWGDMMATTDQLFTHLCTYTQKGTVDEWYQQIKHLTVSLSAQGSKDLVTPSIEIHNCIRGLTPALQDHVQAMRLLQPGVNHSLEELCRYARQKETSLRSAQAKTKRVPPVVNQIQSEPRKWGYQGKDERKKRLARENKCFDCEQVGHRAGARDCPKQTKLK